MARLFRRQQSDPTDSLQYRRAKFRQLTARLGLELGVISSVHLVDDVGSTFLVFAYSRAHLPLRVSTLYQLRRYVTITRLVQGN